MRLIWAFGVESRQSSAVLPCLQSCFEDLRALTGGSRPPILRLHSDKASEFFNPHHQGVFVPSIDEDQHNMLANFAENQCQ